MTVDTAGVVPVWTQGDLLRKAREHAQLEQGDLAQRLGVSRQTVSNAERGTRRPRRALVMAWAMATGVSLAWLESAPPTTPTGPAADVVRPLGLEPRTQWFRARRHLSIVEERAA